VKWHEIVCVTIGQDRWEWWEALEWEALKLAYMPEAVKHASFVYAYVGGWCNVFRRVAFSFWGWVVRDVLHGRTRFQGMAEPLRGGMELVKGS